MWCQHCDSLPTLVEFPTLPEDVSTLGQCSYRAPGGKDAPLDKAHVLDPPARIKYSHWWLSPCSIKGIVGVCERTPHACSPLRPAGSSPWGIPDLDTMEISLRQERWGSEFTCLSQAAKCFQLKGAPTPTPPSPDSQPASSRANRPCCLPPQARGWVLAAKSLGLGKSLPPWASNRKTGVGDRLHSSLHLIQWGSRRFSAQPSQAKPSGARVIGCFVISRCPSRAVAAEK